MSTLRILFVVCVTAASFGAGADLALSEERPIAALNIQPGGTPGPVRVASNGSAFLVTWPTGFARVSSDGVLLDRPSRLLNDPGNANSRDVTADGRNFIAGWTVALERRLYLSQIDASTGEVTRLREAISIAAEGTELRLASSASLMAAAYRGNDIGSTFVTLFRRDGTTVRTLFYESSTHELAGTPRGFAVLLDHSLELIDGITGVVQSVSLPGDGVSSSVTSSESDVAIVQRTGTELKLLRISHDGQLLSSTSVFIADGLIYSAAVTTIAGEYLVAWTSSPPPLFPLSTIAIDLSAARFTANGQLAERKIISPSFAVTDNRFVPPPAPPDLATNGVTGLLVWSRSSLGGDAQALAITPGRDSVPFSIVTAAAAQHVVTATTNGENALVAWWENGELRAARISPDGRSLDPDGLPLKVFDPTVPVDSAFDGRSTVVVWSEGSGIFGVRISIDGLVGQTFQISRRRGVPDIACASGTCVVVWRDISASEVFVSRIRNEAVIDPDGVSLGAGSNVAVATSGRSFVIVVSRQPSIYEAILSTVVIADDGQTLSPVRRDFAYSTGLSSGAPKVVWTDDSYVVLWSAEGGVRGMHLDAAANAIDGEQTAWKGVLVGAVALTEVAIVSGRIAVASYQRDVVLLDADSLQPEAVLRLDERATSIALTATANGRGMIAYTRPVTEPSSYITTRAFVRFLTEPARARAVRAR